MAKTTSNNKAITTRTNNKAVTTRATVKLKDSSANSKKSTKLASKKIPTAAAKIIKIKLKSKSISLKSSSLKNKNIIKNNSIKNKSTQNKPIKNKNKTLLIEQIIDEQKQLTKPDMKILDKINLFVASINKELSKNKINASASIGGSVAKGTFIKGNFDADIFVKFDLSYRGKNISEILEKILIQMNLKANKVHGSRDYFQIKYDITYEIVPVLQVSEYRQAENVADMSPLHVDYFNKKTKTIKNLRDEIRVIKLFMKSARVYGAESYIKGFSGHVVDLLAIKYESFLGVVKAVSKWRDESIIDIEKHHIDPKMSLNTSKISGPLIIVDPLQKNRNAAAALSKECFNEFKDTCTKFLENPSNEFFEMPDFEKIVNEKISKSKNANIFIINIEPHEGKRDVIGSKVLKIKEHMEKISAEEDFELLWSDWFFNENLSKICFAFKKEEFGTTKKIRGPPLDMKDAVESFKKRHSKTFVEHDYIYANESREYPNAKLLLEKLLTYPFIVDKYKSYSIDEKE